MSYITNKVDHLTNTTTRITFMYIIIIKFILILIIQRSIYESWQIVTAILTLYNHLIFTKKNMVLLFYFKDERHFGFHASISFFSFPTYFRISSPYITDVALFQCCLFLCRFTHSSFAHTPCFTVSPSGQNNQMIHMTISVQPYSLLPVENFFFLNSDVFVLFRYN